MSTVFHSPHLRGQKYRPNNPSFASNDIFYGNSLSNTRDSVSKQIDFGNTQKQQDVISQPSFAEKRYSIASPLPISDEGQQQQNFKKNKHAHSSTFTSQDFKALQITPKNNQQNQINFEQKERIQSKSPISQSKYNTLSENYHRYEKKTKIGTDQVDNEIALRSINKNRGGIAQFDNEDVQDYQKRLQEERDLQRGAVSPYSTRSNREYLDDYYKKKKMVRVEGKLQESTKKNKNINNKSAIDLKQKLPFDGELVIHPHNNKCAPQEQNGQITPKARGKFEDYTQNNGNNQVQFDQQSVKSAKSGVSKSTSVLSTGSYLLCEPCYNGELRCQRNQKEQQERQEDKQLQEMMREKYLQDMERTANYQNSMKIELSSQMNNFFKKKLNPLETKVDSHNTNVNQNRDMIQEQQRIYQEERLKKKLQKEQDRQEMAQTLEEQIKNKQQAKNQERMNDLQWAIDVKLEEIRRQKEAERLNKQKQKLSNTLQQQLDQHQQQKEKQIQDKKAYGEIENSIIQYYKDNQLRKEDLQEVQKQLRDIDRLNKSLQEKGLLKSFETKKDIKNTLEQQMNFHKQQQLKEKQDNNYLTTIPLKPKPCPKTSKCGNCKHEVIADRMVKMKKGYLAKKQ